MPLCSRYHALELENEKRVGTGQDPGKANCEKLVQLSMLIRTTATRKVHRMLVIGDSFLRGTEVPIFQSDNISGEVCCLPEAHFCDVMERLLSLVKPTDYHPFLLFQVGKNDAAMR